jgi:hypothetical protein
MSLLATCGDDNKGVEMSGKDGKEKVEISLWMMPMLPYWGSE